MVCCWWPVTTGPEHSPTAGWAAVLGRGGKPDDVDIPVRSPDTTLAEVRQAITGLPGATITHGLFWHYLLTWQPHRAGDDARGRGMTRDMTAPGAPLPPCPTPHRQEQGLDHNGTFPWMVQHFYTHLWGGCTPDTPTGRVT